MPPENETPWQRLGRLLAARREQIAPRYKNKNLFAEERGIHRRMLWSVESGARDTYTNGTLQDVESAYMLIAGSITRTLAGAPLEPLDRAAAEPRDPEWRPAVEDDSEPRGDAAWDLFPDDPVKRHVWRTPGMSERDRAELIALIDRKRAEAHGGGESPRREANAS
jgi:hypothetical protein